MTSRRRSIAFVVDSVSSDYTMQLWQATQRAAEASGANTLAVVGLRLAGPTVFEATQNRIYELVDRSLVDGVILVSSVLAHYCGIAGLLDLCKRYAPLPICSVGLQVPGIPSLVVDNGGGMERGVGHLLDVHRCRRVAFIAAQPNSEESNLRLMGYRKAHHARKLKLDERLIVHGDFMLQSGAAAIKHLLAHSIEFDAVMAANDSMALGAMDVLQQSGLAAKKSIPVFGFDDIRAASCAKPSLSTLRQPMSWLGTEAVTLILRQIEGESVPACGVGEVDLVRRESCGCGLALAASLVPADAPAANLRTAIAEHRAAIERLLYDEVFASNRGLGAWPAEIVDGLCTELAGFDGQFAVAFEQLLDRAEQHGTNLDEFHRLISLLRRETRSFQLVDSTALDRIERIWHAARISVSAASIRSVSRYRIEMEWISTLLARSGERLATALSLPGLKLALCEDLPGLGIQQICIALFESGFDSPLHPLLVTRDGSEVAVEERAYARAEIAELAGLDITDVHHYALMPLTFEGDSLGIAIFGTGALPHVYWSLRQQIGAAIKGAQLHRQIVAQVSLRERLDQQRAREETRLAVEIQTNMLPTDARVPGLEIAQVMLPAAESGGDYFDILPTAAGAWLAIGDVAGHGLGAGLIMLMIQSMISTLVRANGDISPSELLCAVNASIYDNVRHRLHRDEHATLTAMRYERSGRIVFAGAHEPILVYRNATRTIETVIPQGMWLGAIPDVRDTMSDGVLQLEDQDVMVLYTDGVTEPRNPHLEQFGLERLASLVRSLGDRTAGEIRDKVVEAVKRWSSSLDDDLTLLVVRYRSAVA